MLGENLDVDVSPLAPYPDVPGLHYAGGGIGVIGGEGSGGVKVADIFAELPALEAGRDDGTWIRFARDGSTRVVEWKCSSCHPCEEGYVGQEWCQDWQAGVTTVDPATPLYFQKAWRMPPELRELESSEPEE